MIPGKAYRDLRYLCPCIRQKCIQLNRDFEQLTGDFLVVIETLRNEERQHYYLSIGASRTMNSKHLPQPPDDLSLAFDACPNTYLSLKAWHPRGIYWKNLGALGRKLGLEWGGDWKSFPDQPHFQLPECQCNR